LALNIKSISLVLLLSYRILSIPYHLYFSGVVTPPVKTHQPDVALVDIGLPDIDGIEVTQKLKEYQAPGGVVTPPGFRNYSPN
jgi:DNA-binding LytR/AlgR family response regulator